MVGVAIADVATCSVFVGQFRDDASRTRLRTLMARVEPAELVLPLGPAADGAPSLSATTARFLRFDAARAVVAPFPARSQWPDAAGAARLCSTRRYFAGRDVPPPLAASFAAAADVSGGDDACLGVASASAFGALALHLRRCLLDIEVLSGADFGTYQHEHGLVLPPPPQDPSPAVSLASASSSSSSSASGAAPAPGTSAESLGALRVLAAARALVPPGPRMLLDASSLVNLEVLGNSVDGGERGSLLQAVGRCTSPAGKREFRQWLCAPLRDVRAIEDRLDAVELLLPAGQLGAQAAEARGLLGKVPDLDRLLSRITARGSKRLAEEHPESRAIMYEGATYAKRQVADLVKALQGLGAARRVRALFHASPEEAEAADPLRLAAATPQGSWRAASPPPCASLLPAVTSPLLRVCVGAAFPRVGGWVDALRGSFDADEAQRSGKVVPRPGSHAAYDDGLRAVAGVKDELQAYLETQKRALNCSSLRFWGSGGGASNAASVNDKRFQIEVPERVAASSALPESYLLKSQRKGGKDGGVRRYHTDELSAILERLSEAERAVEEALGDSMRALFERFAAHRAEVEAVARCVAVLDCLVGMAAWAAEGDGAGSMCRPRLVPRSGDVSQARGTASGGVAAAFLSVQAGRHPCVTRLLAERGSGAYVPNDVDVGRERVESAGESTTGASGSCVLLTGPNMGGKSTYLRQAAVATLLAQVGCYVPATTCSLTPADRIFTRVGASDRILAGQSTFFVELAETSAIVNCATADSLVILDELGRGTSTFDGNAIAWAVTRHLTAGCGCRALFATHYHTLTEEFAADPRVTLGHMACMVRRSGNAPATTMATSSASSAPPTAAGKSSSRADEQVTFLYRFANGGCPKSYGLNVARLAQLPEEVIARAGERSAEFEDALAAAIERTHGEEAAQAARGVGSEGASTRGVEEEAGRLLAKAAGQVSGVSDDALLSLVQQAQALGL